MKILLIAPPQYVPTGERKVLLGDPPLGFGDLAAYLLPRGFDVVIKNFYNSDWSDVNSYLSKTINGFDIIGVNCYTNHRASTIRLGELAKNLKPSVKVVAGGIHASLLGERMLELHEQIDAIVHGEGEISFYNLLRSWQGKLPIEEVRGISYRQNGRVKRNEPQPLIADLDELDLCAHHLFDFDSIKVSNFLDIYSFLVEEGKLDSIKIWAMSTSRGCVWDCQFCCGAKYWGGRWRARSPGKVVDEMEMLHKKYGINVILILDNEFTINEKRARGVCKEIIRRNLKIYWSCSAHVGRTSMKTLQLMARSGCVLIAYGAESGDKRVLENIGKRITREQIIQTVWDTVKVGIKVRLFLMVGNPGEDDESVRQTMILLDEIPPLDSLGFGKAIIFPGTRLYEHSKKIGFISDDYWDGNRLAPYYTAELDEKILDRYSDQISQKYACIKFKNSINLIKKSTKMSAVDKLFKIFNMSVNYHVLKIRSELKLRSRILKLLK